MKIFRARCWPLGQDAVVLIWWEKDEAIGGGVADVAVLLDTDEEDTHTLMLLTLPNQLKEDDEILQALENRARGWINNRRWAFLVNQGWQNLPAEVQLEEDNLALFLLRLRGRGDAGLREVLEKSMSEEMKAVARAMLSVDPIQAREVRLGP